jgi:hypothetical protein
MHQPKWLARHQRKEPRRRGNRWSCERFFVCELWGPFLAPCVIRVRDRQHGAELEGFLTENVDVTTQSDNGGDLTTKSGETSRERGDYLA